MDYPLKTLSQLRPILVGFRKKAGLTQKDIAARLGISQQSYAAFEANPEAASVERLVRVLRLVDVEIKLGAPEAKAAPVAEKAAPRPARTPAAAAKMSSAAKPAAARKRTRTTPAAPAPQRQSAGRRKPRENW
ncbi:helix-turn-helix domain-containing protein [Paraburkholderia sp. CNPSo 3272]|uniref:helix-turn-helix transcriptional regulator n=1 Tax=Paraburkholderia sp. CNPSo 3272 TaxID=2940931 RepID=UPI0020B65CE3|nr:helix-turn-helix transcriptional regulator [Paraburkholderia sp. CNPSo 3272]MCP3725000.1 helix-turn-helix domain-containing protein [Paraburkholderia sp. CNPSo 3272]